MKWRFFGFLSSDRKEPIAEKAQEKPWARKTNTDWSCEAAFRLVWQCAQHNLVKRLDNHAYTIIDKPHHFIVGRDGLSIEVLRVSSGSFMRYSAMVKDAETGAVLGAGGRDYLGNYQYRMAMALSEKHGGLDFGSFYLAKPKSAAGAHVLRVLKELSEEAEKKEQTHRLLQERRENAEKRASERKEAALEARYSKRVSPSV